MQYMYVLNSSLKSEYVLLGNPVLFKHIVRQSVSYINPYTYADYNIHTWKLTIVHAISFLNNSQSWLEIKQLSQALGLKTKCNTYANRWQLQIHTTSAQSVELE